MASLKLYLTSDEASVSKTVRGTWDDNSPYSFNVWLDMGTTPSGSVQNPNPAIGSTTANWDLLFARFVYTLTAPVDFTGVVGGVLALAEQNAGANVYAHYHIYVCEGTADTVRGTIASDVIDGEEVAVSAFLTYGEAISTTGSAVSASAGDQIILEVGFRASSSDAGYEVRFGYGGTGDDLTDGASRGTEVPYITLEYDAVPYPTSIASSTDFGEFAVLDSDKSVCLLSDATYEVSTLDVANKVYVAVEGSSPLTVGSATNTTDDPTYADSPREAVVFIKSGDATFCDTVAAAQLAVMKVERYRLNGLPVPLRHGLGIERGQTVLITIPRAGIYEVLPVRRLEHDFAANVTRVDVGEFAAARDDQMALVEITKKLDQLTKEVAVG